MKASIVQGKALIASAGIGEGGRDFFTGYVRFHPFSKSRMLEDGSYNKMKAVRNEYRALSTI